MASPSDNNPPPTLTPANITQEEVPSPQVAFSPPPQAARSGSGSINPEGHNTNDHAFLLLVTDYPNLTAEQHSVLLVLALECFYNRYECCELLPNLHKCCSGIGLKFKQGKAILNKLIEKTRPMLMYNQMEHHFNPNIDLVIPINMPYSSPDSNISKAEYELCITYLFIFRKLQFDKDNDTTGRMDNPNLREYLMAPNVPRPPARSKAHTPHAGSSGDPEDPADPDDGRDDDEDSDDESEDNDFNFQPYVDDLNLYDGCLDIVDFLIENLKKMVDDTSQKRYLAQQRVRSYAQSLIAYEEERKVCIH